MFEARVFRVLVASPSDVGDERTMIPEVISEWNAVNGFELKAVLLPVKWEDNAFPETGGRPQGLLNRQIVDACDLLVGVFWTRVGTETGTHISGTVEEIEHFAKSEKPAMLYFSQSPVDPDRIDIKQLESMRAFRENMRVKGLTESYSGIADFRSKFARQLAYRMNSTLKATQNSRSIYATRGKADNAAAESSLEASKGKVSTTHATVSAQAADKKMTKEQVRSAVVESLSAIAKPDGWANASALGKYLRTFTPVDHKSMGFRTLVSFLRTLDYIELRQEKKSPNAQGLDSADVRLRR